MKILHYSANYDLPTAAALCEGLCAAGHAVTAMTAGVASKDDRSDASVGAIQQNGVSVLRFPGRMTPFGVHSPELQRAVYERAHEFDLIHVGEVWQIGNLNAALAAKDAGIPFVVSTLGALQRASFKEQRWKKWAWFWFRERSFLTRAAAIHCLSSFEEREMARFGLDTRRFVVPTGISTDVWYRDESAGKAWRASIGAQPDEIVVLFAGRLQMKQGLELLPSVVDSLAKSRKVKLVLAGVDGDGTRAHLQTAFRVRGAGQTLKVVGQLSEDDLRAACSGADVFVFPSLGECFSIAAIEALACGCPLVISDRVGNAGDLSDLNLVRVASPKNAEWTRAIEELLDLRRDPSVRADVIKQVEARFSRGAVAAAMAKEYGRLNAAPGAAGVAEKLDRHDIATHRRTGEGGYGFAGLTRSLLWSVVRPAFRFSPQLLNGWRNFLLRSFGAKIGNGVRIHPTARIFAPWSLDIGDEVSVSWNVTLHNAAKIAIGSRSMVSQNAHLCAANLDCRRPHLPSANKPVIIESDCWICADSFVGPGVTVRRLSVVAARAVVVRDVPERKIVGGNPGRIIGER